MAVVSSALPQGIGLIELKGTFLGGHEIDEVQKAVRKYVEAGQQKLLIDASEVTYLNSSAIGALVAAYTTYARRHWRLVFCGDNKVVHTMLAVTKLNRVMAFHPSRGEAVRELAG
jgi:anti-sigma B factor antagonist